ncbi:carbamoyl-phosphate synthase small subunit [bacterium]|nr:carbamoyl-phosphate synthase small subunit [bacterium]
MDARLIFEDGTVFHGRAFAGSGERFGEVVFNTAMSGYQEVLTDPSYCGQMVLMTYPMIGSYGINTEDVESRGLFLEALLVREYIDFPSNWRSKQSLKSYLEQNGVLGVEGLDTRAITRYLRDHGAQRTLLTTSNESLEIALRRIKSSPTMQGLNLADKVSASGSYQWPMAGQAPEFRVAVIDTGVKYNILRLLASHGCDCTVFPSTIDANEILAQDFDGVFLSNGPGDPEPVTSAITAIKTLLGKVPIFGICLGHQLLWLALGGKTYKLKFGHHGANHPVKNLATGHVEITSQNHGFCVDAESLSADDIEVTHVNLNDHTVEGFKHRKFPAFSVQYHPESAPGPHDSKYLFKEFVEMMRVYRDAKAMVVAQDFVQ